MPRYIRIPEAVPLSNPDGTHMLHCARCQAQIEDGARTATFAQAMGVVLGTMMQELDALVLIDIKRKLCGAEPGAIVELSDDHWTALRDKYKRPAAFTPAYLFNAEPHLRAVLDAPTERPAVAVAPAVA